MTKCLGSFIKYPVQPAPQQMLALTKTHFPDSQQPAPYLNLLASRSDSSRQRMSSSRTENIDVSFIAHQEPADLRLASSSCMLRDIRGKEFCAVRTWAFDVADDASGGIVHKLDSDLSNTSSRTYIPSESIPLYLRPCPCCRDRIVHTGTAQDTGNLHKLDGDL